MSELSINQSWNWETNHLLPAFWLGTFMLLQHFQGTPFMRLAVSCPCSSEGHPWAHWILGIHPELASNSNATPGKSKWKSSTMIHHVSFLPGKGWNKLKIHTKNAKHGIPFKVFASMDLADKVVMDYSHLTSYSDTLWEIFWSCSSQRSGHRKTSHKLLLLPNNRILGKHNTLHLNT